MGIDTEDNIPRKLKSAAYDMWGRDGCVMCGSNNKTDLAHISHDGTNPYHDTEPYNLMPMCKSCHNKLDRLELRRGYQNEDISEKFAWTENFMKAKGGMIKLTAIYLSKHMAKMTSLTLEEFLNDNFDNIIEGNTIGISKNQKSMIKEAYERLGFNFDEQSLETFYEYKLKKKRGRMNNNV